MGLEIPVQNSRLFAIPEYKRGPIAPIMKEIITNHIQIFGSVIKLTRYVSKQKENILVYDQGLGTYVLSFRFYTHQTVDGTNKSTSNEAIMKENNQVEGNASIVPKECF